MFRRMRNQGDDGAQFYLYRVQLTRDCVIEPGIHPEPTNWLGDANLADVCRPDVQVLRYVNVHEDPSSVSLAIELNAIHAVQGMAIPLQVDPSDTRILEAIARLRNAASEPPPPPEGNCKGCDGNRPHRSRWRPADSKPTSLPDYRQPLETRSARGSTRPTSSQNLPCSP